MKRVAVLSVIGTMAVLAACGGGAPQASNSPTPSASFTRLASTAHLKIISPTPNEVIHGSTLHVKVELTGATIVPRATTTVTPSTGHIHIIIDGQTVSIYAGAEYDATGLTPGLHLLKVEFVMANHAFFDPRVIVTQAFRVA